MKPVLIRSAVLLLALLASASGGCVQVQSRPYIGVQAFSPTKPDSIEILRTAPTKPHLRLGEITVEPKSNTSVQTIEEKFRQAAAKMGANAVVIVADRTELMGMMETGPWYGAEMTPVTGRVIMGVAIRYTSASGPGLAPGQVRSEEHDADRIRTAERSGTDQGSSGG
jgi:hypothetical protein